MPYARPAAVLPTLTRGAFVAIDFETADHGADSACAIGLSRVEDLRVVRTEAVLIRPPRKRILFTGVHGITEAMVANAELFGPVWDRLRPMLDGAACLAAHNAAFDRRVLEACCLAAGVPAPALPYLCSVQVARQSWQCRPANLAAVCRRLGIGLIHHHAGSDAEACARIVIAAATQCVSIPAAPRTA